MGSIDKYAYLSNLRLMDPIQKIILFLTSLFLCLFSKSVLLHSLVIVVMSYIVVGIGRTSWRIYMKCLFIPSTFLLLSLTTIVLEFGNEGSIFLYRMPVFSIYIGMTEEGIRRGGTLFLKVIASITCLYGLSLSTPITDLLKGFKVLKCPDFLIELMALIYRFIFVLVDSMTIMRHSQESRLGYYDFKTGVGSFGLLLSMSLLQALKMNEELYIALEARGYTGSFQVLNHERYWKVPYYQMILLGLTYFIVMAIDKWFL